MGGRVLRRGVAASANSKSVATPLPYARKSQRELMSRESSRHPMGRGKAVLVVRPPRVSQAPSVNASDEQAVD